MLQPRRNSQLSRKKIEEYSYGLNDVIGKGYSSTVYRGKHDESGRDVAVKVIDLKQLKNDINRILLQSQMEILKELRQLPHILHLYEVYTTKNNTYLITELCESDVNKLVKKRMQETEAHSFMAQLLKGYMHLAQKDIIHRDLKPANLFITKDKVLKIGDFGFAVRAELVAKPNKYNVGSPLYMAPQSLRNNQYSVKSDIWALGIIFYELIIGDTPWKAKNQKQLLSKIQMESIEEVLMRHKMTKMAKQFLTHSLQVDKTRRMSPEQLQKYQFREVPILNKHLSVPKTILSEKKTIQTQRNASEKKLLNNTLQNRINQETTQSFKKIAHQRPKNHSVQRVQKQNPQFNQHSKQKRHVSKVLISQVHFCRFLFKLVSRISQLNNPSLPTKEVFCYFTRLIRSKIQDLLRFPSHNYIKAANYEEYKQTPDYIKLMKIAQEYHERYRSELKEYWHEVGSAGHCVNHLLRTMYEATSALDSEGVEHHAQQIIAIDYLITAQQLIQLMHSLNSHQLFARKSRIEETVEGKTLAMSMGLYCKIMERAKNMVK